MSARCHPRGPQGQRPLRAAGLALLRAPPPPLSRGRASRRAEPSCSLVTENDFAVFPLQLFAPRPGLSVEAVADRFRRRPPACDLPLSQSPLAAWQSPRQPPRGSRGRLPRPPPAVHAPLSSRAPRSTCWSPTSRVCLFSCLIGCGFWTLRPNPNLASTP